MHMAASCFQADEIQLAVMDATLSRDFIGKATDIYRGAFENDGLDTVLMVQMAVHAGNRQVMMVMLKAGQSLRQKALMVVINIGEIGNALSIKGVALPVGFDGTSYQVTNRFGPIVIASRGDKPIELGCQGVVQGDGEAFHSGYFGGKEEPNFPFIR